MTSSARLDHRGPHRRRRRHLAAAGTAALALAITATGCTSSKPGAAPRGDITFGVLTTLSGDQATRGQDLLDGAQMAADELNNRGGVIGLNLKLSSADDQCLDVGAREAAKMFVNGDNVAGAIGGICDESSTAAAEVLGGLGVPFLVTSANAPTIVNPDDTPTAYLTNGTPYQEALAVVHWLAYNNAQRLAVISDDTPEATYLADQVISVTSPVPEIVSKQTITPTGADLTATATTALASTPDVIYFAGDATNSGHLAAALHTAGYTGKYFASAASESPDYLTAAGPGAEGTFVITPASPQNLPAAADWATKFTKQFNHAPGRDALQAYEAVRALAQAVTQTGQIDPAGNADQLTKLDDTFTTFMGEMSFAPDHTIKYDSHLVLTVTGGTFTVANTLRTDG